MSKHLGVKEIEMIHEFKNKEEHVEADIGGPLCKKAKSSFYYTFGDPD
jgi:hypothetical protein